jgi:hypothetical protein
MAPIALKRTFKQIDTAEDDDDTDWAEYVGFEGASGSLTWPDLHRRHVVVVLGEAGIGKTVEFEMEVDRLTETGEAAFLIPLNLLKQQSDWRVALGKATRRFEEWRNGSAIGYFHLDSVDEARLTSHADLAKALAIVNAALDPHLSRVRIAISSRLSDWTERTVPDLVRAWLLDPIDGAISDARAEKLLISATLAVEVNADAEPRARANDSEELLVTSLDPLSRDQAALCARHFEVDDERGFWAAVESGDYLHMATRPLDLGWMVRLWNRQHALGTYRELIEANVTERLVEVNAHYTQARRVLAPTRLRYAAAQLAAATEFGGIAYLSLAQDGAGDNMLNPYRILWDYQPDEVQHLLNTALFDEASFNRVRFQHRSVREYLAACWVDHKLGLGVPLRRLILLFAGAPYGKTVLIPARRSSLSWLAAINVKAREWCVHHAPELLIHDGDPESWDRASVEKAFDDLVRNAPAVPALLEARYSGSEMRAARALGGAAVAAVLADRTQPWQAFSLALRLASTGRLPECAEPTFAIYTDPTRANHDRTAALSVLQEIAQPRHRAQLMKDIQSGALQGNEVIGEALPATDWWTLSADQLADIFMATSSENHTVNGPMVSAINDGLLPRADLAGATTLLAAVLKALPREEPGRPYAQYPVEDRPERAWLLDVLPDCLERVLLLSVPSQAPPESICIEASVAAARLRDSGFTHAGDLAKLRDAIRALPALRWSIALAISPPDNCRGDRASLAWDPDAIVTFAEADLGQLAARAQDSEQPSEARDLWFLIGMEVAIRARTGRQRSIALRSLCEGAAAGRPSEIQERLRELRSVRRTQRQWQIKHDLQARTQQAKFDQYVDQLMARADGIASGADIDGLRLLLRSVFNTKAWRNRGDLDFEIIASRFGQRLANAFATGLEKFWLTCAPPDPTQRSGSSIPEDVLLALAGAYAFARNAGEFSGLTDVQATHAASLAVWALPAPPSWFDALYAAKPEQVLGELKPRLEREAKANWDGHGALRLALQAAPLARRKLLIGIKSLVTAGEIADGRQWEKVIDALISDGLLSGVEVEEFCRRKLSAGRAKECISDLRWLRVWLTARPAEAWSWFKRRLAKVADKKRQITQFAAEMSEIPWSGPVLDPATIDLTCDIFDVVERHASDLSVDGELDNSFFGSPTSRLLGAILGSLTSLGGILGHKALLRLRGPGERTKPFDRLLITHAQMEIAARANWSMEQLRGLHAAFDGEPATEELLFDQVLLRLEDIKADVEVGRFSERVLFRRGMREEALQHWLAARLFTSQGLRFSVHREEEFDARKKPDITCAVAAGSVCVEIKPLDGTRSYSAQTLVEDTLKTQLVDQYLKEENSTSGVLVVMQLDRKRWQIPGCPTLVAFEDLVAYLQTAADRIRVEVPRVKALRVIGISCVEPRAPGKKSSRKRSSASPGQR